MGKYIKSVGNKQEQFTARGGENLTLLAEGGFVSEMISVADEQLDNIARSVTPHFKATLDRLTRKNQSADVSRLERISLSLAIKTAKRRLNRHIKILFVCACDCWESARQKGKKQIRRIVGRVRRTIVSATGLFRASSAEAASRHRESDDAGGDGSDPDDSDLPPRQRSEIQYLRSLTGRKGGILEQTYRTFLLGGGVAR